MRRRFECLVTIGTIATAAAQTAPAGQADGPGDYRVATNVSWQAKWIWDGGAASPRNFYLLAVKDLDVADAGGVWRAHVSGDSRYRFYVNGEWMGDGPARCFPFNQEFDTYDLTGVLAKGKNRLAILVSHYGEGTFQYNPTGQAGALVQLERQEGDGWKVAAVSDDTWRVRHHDGFIRPTPRISCQMPFEEIYDARALPPNCVEPGATEGFTPAKIVAAVGEGPWKRLVPRSVPMFTRELVPPVRVFRTRLVKTPNLFFGLTLRPYLLKGYFMQNHQHLNGFAATILQSPIEQEARFFSPMGRFENVTINGKLTKNGEPVKLEKGDNLCTIVCKTGTAHEFDRCYAAFVAEGVKMKGVFNDKTAWTVFGPFDDYKAVHGKAARAKTLEDLTPYKDKARIVSPEHVLTAGSPWTETTFADAVEASPTVDNLEALCCASPETTVIHPSEKGHPEILLDFGKEVVGQLTFDLVAPAGVVLDFNCFEEIEDGKRFHYSEGNLSALRYITREGRQQYTSFLRRGYRYCQVTLRNMTGPVRIRSIHTVFSSSPPVQRGSFACSDPLLNKIWEVGRHTLRCCAEDTFTDCPTYEQTYWVGDGRNEAMVDYAAFGDVALTRRCAELPGQSLFRQLIPESQVPSAWDNLLTAWALLWVQMVEEHYEFSGDKEYLKKAFADVGKTLRNIHANLRDDKGLLKISAWNMFDWAGQDSGHDVVTHNQMFLVEALRRATSMAKALGQDKDAAFFEQYRRELIDAINKHLWDDRRGAYIDSIHNDGKPSTTISQQTNSLAIAYDVAPPERLERIKDVPFKPAKGMVKVGSPFALFYILEALAKRDRHAELLEVIRDRWGFMVGKGATTFWETFPGRSKDWWTRSYCHAWSAAPTYFLTRYQLGVWWDAPGCATVRIAPQPVDLTWARGRWSTPKGPVDVAWEKKAGKFTAEVALPDGVAGVIELPGKPGDYRSVTVVGGQAEEKDGRWQIRLPAGASVEITAEITR
ncbi:MAG: family 78 glycoside hydrolase catalytic domain [Phycisphaerae bacterium]|nr:family 78 glycoside hydrolase catalytic domain [Phycisphaerae bacterium]